MKVYAQNQFQPKPDAQLRARLLQLKQEFNEKLDRDNEGEWLSWWIAEDAFELPEHTIDKLHKAGPALQRFFSVANDLYYQFDWIRDRLDKTLTPNYQLLNNSQQEALPIMPRPDVILDGDWNPYFVELEITVCARFDTAVMEEQYALEVDKGFIRHYANYFNRQWPGKTLALLTAPHPLWWYIVDEAIPFAERLKREGLNVIVLDGQNIPHLRFDGKQLWLCRRDAAAEPIHVIDSFIDIYEIAELQHPGMAPLLDAYAAGAIGTVNTFKQFLDEKAWMSLFWDPQLRDSWRQRLGESQDTLLRSMIPRTWDVRGDMTIELSDGTCIPLLNIAELPQQQRLFVLKESGTSSTSSGAQSLKVLSEATDEEVRKLLASVIDSGVPHVIQQTIDSPRIGFTALDPEHDKVMVQDNARIKLSAFYLDGALTNIKFIASNSKLAVNDEKCVEGIVRY